MTEIKLAIPTEGENGIEEVVSEVFGRAKTFTIVEIGDGTVKRVEVVENSAVSYKQGTGPIVVKMLVDLGVTMVGAREFGPGASALLEHHDVKLVTVKPGKTVGQVVEDVLKGL